MGNYRCSCSCSSHSVHYDTGNLPSSLTEGVYERETFEKIADYLNQGYRPDQVVVESGSAGYDVNWESVRVRPDPDPNDDPYEGMF